MQYRKTANTVWNAKHRIGWIKKYRPDDVSSFTLVGHWLRFVQKLWSCRPCKWPSTPAL